MKIKLSKISYAAMTLVVLSGAGLAHAESWGVKFLGRTTSTNYAAGPDLVTGTAGVVPSPGWNNITNYQDSTGYGFTTGTIKSSDGSLTATLTISGTTKGQGNSGGWQSGAPSDGGNGSLANGYLDLGANIGGAETNVVSGLTGSSYTLYVYNYSDASHPGNGGDYLPNYSANGITYYAPQYGSGATSWNVDNVPVGGPFTGWKKAKATLVNYNSRVPNTNDFGNYLEIDNVVPVGGSITFVGQQSNQSWRSPLDGFQLVLETQAVAPYIDAQTPSVTNFAGSTVQVQVVAGGTPLNFQWKAGAVGSGVYTNLINGGQISGVTNSTLTISNFTPLNVGDYIVIITNSAGSVTSSVPTTLSIAPMSINGPTPAGSQVYPGEIAFFSVTVAGAEPLTYHWRKNGVVLSNGGHVSGANTNKLVISNADNTDAATYDVVVTNVFDSVTSTPVVFSLAAAPITGSYAESIKTNGAVAYWRLNETDVDPTTGNAVAYDFIGGRAGAYGASTLNGADGIVGPVSPAWAGFEAANTAVQMFPGYTNSLIEVPSVEALNLNTNTVTIVAWVNPSAVVINAGIVFQRQNGVLGLVTGNTGNLGFNWNDNAASWGWDSGLALPLNQWSFVALVVSPTAGRIYMYNANSWTNASVDLVNANASFAGPLDIGTDTQDPMARSFTGNIDEVAIFNKSLTPVQIAQLLSAATGTTVVPPVNVLPTISIQSSGASLQITWTGTLLESTNVSGPWVTNSTGTSPLIITPAGPQKFYRSK